jgi:hypothetical protein
LKEAEWDSCTDHVAMLAYIQRRKHHRPSRRKLCLFACACSRRIWHLFPQNSCRRAIELAEGVVDGLVTTAELTEQMKVVKAIPFAPYGQTSLAVVHWIVSIILDPKLKFPEYAARQATFYMDRALADERWPARLEGEDAGLRRERRAFLYDVLGNPFRPVTPDLSSLGATLKDLAQSIYDERRFADLPVLADALEEAGFRDELLEHCRQPGEHIRGCWVVDTVLGKS